MRSSDTAIMIKKHPPLPCSIFFERRMFLEQDDDEEKLMSMSGDGKLAPQKRRFRESAHPSLEQVREIIRKKKDGETLETFFSVRGKDSAVIKK